MALSNLARRARELPWTAIYRCVVVALLVWILVEAQAARREAEDAAAAAHEASDNASEAGSIASDAKDAVDDLAIKCQR